MLKKLLWVLAGLLFLALCLIAWPKIVMIRCLSHDALAFSALYGLRARVAEYRQKHGRFPEELSEVGVPDLELYCYDSSRDTIHRHRRVYEALSRPGLGLEGFKVRFSTEPRKGEAKSVLLLADFNGFDPDRGRMAVSTDTWHAQTWVFEAEISTGPHSFRFVLDGREGPLETVTIDHAALHPSIRVTHTGLPEDEGKWVYDPQTGLVALSCSGVDTSKRRPWNQH